jgi:hypothetical protein
MSVEKKLTSNELYEILCKKHPNIIHKKNENLNIYDAKLKIIKKCWYDVKSYPKLKHIADVTGVSERNIQLYAINNNFKKRKTIKHYEQKEIQSAEYL